MRGFKKSAGTRSIISVRRLARSGSVCSNARRGIRPLPFRNAKMHIRHKSARGAIVVALLVATCALNARSARAEKEKPAPAVEVIVDTSAVPDVANWGDEAGELVRKWHPRIAELLKSEKFTPPRKVTLIFKEMDGIAGTSGDSIAISAQWVREHPDDQGMVIHELVHVIQAYPKYEHVWLVEGIADYVRYFHFEPKKDLGPIDFKKASYRDGYGTTARFLAWTEKKYDKQLVRKLNQALRQTKYEDKLFEDFTGKSLDALWKEFIATPRQ
jgi:hypothetical protein